LLVVSRKSLACFWTVLCCFGDLGFVPEIFEHLAILSNELELCSLILIILFVISRDLIFVLFLRLLIDRLCLGLNQIVRCQNIRILSFLLALTLMVLGDYNELMHLLLKEFLFEVFILLFLKNLLILIEISLLA